MLSAMQRVLLLLCALLPLSAPCVACRRAPPGEAREGASSAMREVRLTPSSTPLPDVLSAEARKAKAEGLAPFVLVGATWCGPCQELEKSMHDPRMRKAFSGTYVIHLDVDAWGGRLGKAGLGASAVPVIFALDPEGKPTGRRIDGSAWAENVPENMAPPLSAFFHP